MCYVRITFDPRSFRLCSMFIFIYAQRSGEGVQREVTAFFLSRGVIMEMLDCNTVTTLYLYTDLKKTKTNLTAYFHFKVLLILVRLLTAMYDLAFYNENMRTKRTRREGRGGKAVT